MKTLVLYDSYFGNTQKIAEEISKEFKDSSIKHVKDFDNEDLKDLDLLIVGSPTRAFNPSEKTSAFIRSLSNNNLSGIKVAAFDTRMDLEKAPSKIITFLGGIFGFAADPMIKKLTKRGGEQILEPIGFLVKDSEGPLEDGEIQKAKNWVSPISS
jgi:flavodoxin I